MKPEGDLANFTAVRTAGSPSAYALENTGHNWGHGKALSYLWLADLLALRLPASIPEEGPVPLRAIEVAGGWLGDNVTREISAAVSASAPSSKSWFPTHDFATAWVEFTK